MAERYYIYEDDCVLRKGKQSRGVHAQRSYQRSVSGSRVLTIAGLPDGLAELPTSWCNASVQESDGNFFESFTALSWKQENRRLRASKEFIIEQHYLAGVVSMVSNLLRIASFEQKKDEKEVDKQPPSELQFVPRPKVQPLRRKEFELLYIEVLYTIKHKIGTTTSAHLPYIQDLYQYAKESFGITPEDHARLLAKATEEKPPILILNVTVIEAHGLEAKDADGFSDPYCMLGIMPDKGSPLFDESTVVFSSDDEQPRSRDREKRGPLRKLSQSFRKKKAEMAVVKDLLPVRLIRATAVRPKTLNPVWNEKFRFDLGDVQAERLHLDIWDHDDEFSVVDAAKKLNEVSSLRGLGRYFKQVAQSARTRNSSSTSVDDFLGCVNIPLHDIPSTGSDIWAPLEARSSRSNVQGEIHLKMSLATREDQGIAEDDNWTDIRQHEDLMCIFIDHERRLFQDSTYKWTGQLSQAATTILHQHAIQGDVTDAQRSVVRWIAYSRKHVEHPFDYKFLISLLDDIDEKWQPDSLSTDEEKSLAESFTIFIDFSLVLIRKHRDIFPPANNAAFTRLEDLLRTLVRIYSIKVYKHVCPFQRELTSEIISTLRKGTLEWYERMLSVSKSQKTQSDEDSIRCIIELTNLINDEMHRSFTYYNQLFELIVEVKYFQITFLQIEKLLSGDVNKILEDELGEKSRRSSSIVDESDMVDTLTVVNSTILFEMYLGLQEFCKYKEHIPHGDWKSLSIVQFYEWFKGPIQKWLNMAKPRMTRRVQKAVDIDKVSSQDGSVKYSTSAVDISSCYKQIVEFWKHLSWPEHIGSYKFVSQITEIITQSSMLYADLIHDKLKDAGYYDDEGQFDVTEQLCITINDIEQVRRCLKPLVDSLNFAEIVAAMEKQFGDKGVRQCKASLYNSVKQADDDMVQKIKNVIDHVADRMRPDIKKDVFHLNWSPELVPAEDAVVDLMEYLDSNLLTLNNNLLRTNFNRILEAIWVEVLEEFKEVIETEENVSNSAFYQRMYDSLGLLIDFFHADEKGLPMSTIKCDQFQMLRYQLGLRKMETSELIELFYNEKLEQQSMLDNTDYGTLSIRVWYKADAQTLLVEVISAKDVIPLDTNGLSDPFVLVQLCPEHNFPNLSVQQTKVVKKSLNPVFDESFEFSVSPDQCRSNGATVLLTVMDHDIMFQNDFAGEAFMALCNVPGVNGEEVSGYDALHEIVLPMMQPKHKKRGAFNVLLSRANDKDAVEFTRKRTKVEEQAVDVPSNPGTARR